MQVIQHKSVEGELTVLGVGEALQCYYFDYFNAIWFFWNTENIALCCNILPLISFLHLHIMSANETLWKSLCSYKINFLIC